MPLQDLHLIARDLIASDGAVHECERVGRDSELETIRAAVASGEPTRLMLQGAPGSGRSFCVRSWAQSLINQPDSGVERVLDVNISALSGNTVLITEAVDELIALAEASTGTVLFFENIKSLFDLHHNERGQTGKVLQALSEKDISYIGTVTPEEFKTSTHPIYGRSKTVDIKPLSDQQTLRIVEQLRPSIQNRVGVLVSKGAMRASIELAKFIPGIVLPGGSIQLLNQACDRYRLKYATKLQSKVKAHLDSSMAHLGTKVSYYDVKRVVEELTSRNIEGAQAGEYAEKLRERITANVIGQDSAVANLSNVMARVCVSINTGDQKTDAIFLCGPPGCGKMRTVRTLAEALLHDENDLSVYSMAEYTDPDEANALFGLKKDAELDFESSRLMRNVQSAPLTFVVFENISSAPACFFESLNMILTTGYLRDVNGNHVSFRRTLFFLMEDMKTWSPSDKDVPQKGAQLAKQFIPRDLVAKVKSFIQFKPLEADDLEAILCEGIRDFQNRFGSGKPEIRVHKKVMATIIERAESSNNKGEALQDRLNRYILDPVSQLLSKQTGHDRPVIKVSLDGDRIRLQKD